MGDWLEVISPTAGSVVSATTFGVPVAENMSDTGWIPVTSFGAGSGSFPGYPVKYRRIGNCVLLQGALTNGSVSPAFTLPTGFVPSDAGQLFSIAAQGNGPAMQVVYIGTLTAGNNVAPKPGDVWLSSSNDEAHLTGISFYVD